MPLSQIIKKIEKEFDSLYDIESVGEYSEQIIPKSMRISPIRFFVSSVLTRAYEAGQEAKKITGETSDGYHTFNELYEFRRLYNALLFNEWAKQGKYDIHKSERHSDGQECFGGNWFIVVAQLPTGQISNHYEIEYWNLFQCEIRERGAEWDGHTPKDVLIRLSAIQEIIKPDTFAQCSSCHTTKNLKYDALCSKCYENL